MNLLLRTSTPAWRGSCNRGFAGTWRGVCAQRSWCLGQGSRWGDGGKWTTGELPSEMGRAPWEPGCGNGWVAQPFPNEARGKEHNASCYDMSLLENPPFFLSIQLGSEFHTVPHPTLSRKPSRLPMDLSCQSLYWDICCLVLF